MTKIPYALSAWNPALNSSLMSIMKSADVKIASAGEMRGNTKGSRMHYRLITIVKYSCLTDKKNASGSCNAESVKEMNL